MAAHEIKTTLAVDGEQAFKRSLNEAKQSIRNFGTQLTLAQAEFKKTGDAQKLMETRAKALRSEIDQQNEIVKALEKAVDEAGKKYGEGSKEAEKWQAELNRAKAAMANLESELNNNQQGLDRSGKAFVDAADRADDFKDAVNGIGKGVSFQMITSGIGSITSGFEGAIKKAVQLGEQMWDMMRQAAGWADDEITLASVYGVTTDDLQRMQSAAKAVDTDVETVIKARKKLATAMNQKVEDDQDQATYNKNKKKNQAAKEDTDLQKAFKDLRVPVIDQATGKMRDLENVFWDAGKAIMDMDGKINQNDVAMKIFGKSWDELRPMFEKGRQAYQEALDTATIVPQENLERLGALQDQLDKLDEEFNALKMNVLSELAPAFETLAGALTSLMAEFNAYLQSDAGKEMMQKLRDALDQFFSGIKDIDFTQAVNTVTDALDGVEKAFDWIIKNKDSLDTALKVIAAGFVALKLASAGIQVAKVAEGLGNLLHLGGNKTPTTTTTPTIPTTPTTPTTPTAPTATETAVKTGLFSRIWTGVKTGTKAVAETGLYALPFAMGIDALVSAENQRREMRANAEEAAQHTSLFKSQNGASDMINEWEALDAYLKNPDTTSGSEKMGKFVDEYFKWFNDEITSEALEKLTEGMTDEEYDRFHEAMLMFREGTPLYSESEREALYGPLQRALEIAEEIIGEETSRKQLTDEINTALNLPGGLLTDGVNSSLYAGAGAGGTGDKEGLTSKDVQEFGKLPASLQQSIKTAVSSWVIKIDGQTAGAVVAPYVDAYLGRSAE